MQQRASATGSDASSDVFGSCNESMSRDACSSSSGLRDNGSGQERSNGVEGKDCGSGSGSGSGGALGDDDGCGKASRRSSRDGSDVSDKDALAEALANATADAVHAVVAAVYHAHFAWVRSATELLHALPPACYAAALNVFAAKREAKLVHLRPGSNAVDTQAVAALPRATSARAVSLRIPGRCVLISEQCAEHLAAATHLTRLRLASRLLAASADLLQALPRLSRLADLHIGDLEFRVATSVPWLHKRRRTDATDQVNVAYTLCSTLAQLRGLTALALRNEAPDSRTRERERGSVRDLGEALARLTTLRSLRLPQPCPGAACATAVRPALLRQLRSLTALQVCIPELTSSCASGLLKIIGSLSQLQALPLEVSHIRSDRHLDAGPPLADAYSRVGATLAQECRDIMASLTALTSLTLRWSHPHHQHYFLATDQLWQLMTLPERAPLRKLRLHGFKLAAFCGKSRRKVLAAMRHGSLISLDLSGCEIDGKAELETVLSCSANLQVLNVQHTNLSRARGDADAKAKWCSHEELLGYPMLWEHAADSEADPDSLDESDGEDDSAQDASGHDGQEPAGAGKRWRLLM